jgi:hypothetical protein
VLISLRYGASQFHPRVMLRRKEESRILTYMFLCAGYPAQSLPKRNTGWWFETFCIVPYIGNLIIPTDELIFFRGVETTNQPYSYWWPIITVILIYSNNIVFYIPLSTIHYYMPFIFHLYPKPRVHKPLVI